ncbi:MAG: hypothetical protein K0Q95_1861 [Bacteroidota bacterium]|jgi:hypothetical protein|nr:hypothetical protein [Bacteroidota bacterium]
MKKNILLILALYIISAASDLHAQVPGWTWVKSGGGSLAEDTKAVATDKDGNIFVTGNFYSSTITFGSFTLSNVGQNDVFLVKYDKSGNVLWARSAGGTGYDLGKAVATDDAGNVYIAGNFQSPSISFGSTTLVNAGAEDVFIAKFNAAGVIQYEYRLGNTGSDQGFGIATDGSGAVYITGSYNNSISLGSAMVSSAGGNDVFVLKLSLAGTVQWMKTAGGPSGDNPGGITVDRAGNAIVTGGYYSTAMTFGTTVINNVAASNYQIFTAKYSSAGNVLWAQSCGSTTTDVTYNVTTDTASNVYICGYISASFNFGGTALNSTGTTDIFLGKYSPAGAEIWGKCIGGSGTDVAYGVATDGNNNVYISGDIGSSGVNFGNAVLNTTGTGRDIFLAKYNELGTAEWATSVGGSFQDYSFAMDIDAAGSVIIAGSTGSSSLSFDSHVIVPVASYDAYVAKMSSLVRPDICMVTVDSLSNYNQIYWDKTPYMGVDSFIVYRETTINTYKKIGAVHRDSLSMLVDTVRTAYFPNTGNPNQGTYKYKLQIKSVLGDSSLMSPWHKSIFVNQTGGVFTFNDYSVESQPTPVPQLVQYLLLRDDLGTGMWNILSANTSSPMNDPNYSLFPNARWRVETDWTISCDPTRATVNTTRSNIKNSALSIGIDNNQVMPQVSVYPNPATTAFRLELTGLKGDVSVSIVNVLGQVIDVNSFEISAAKKINVEFSTQGYTKGVYTIIIESGNQKIHRKLVVN